MKKTKLIFMALLSCAMSCKGLIAPEKDGFLTVSFASSGSKSASSWNDTDNYLLTVTGSGGSVVYDGVFCKSPEVFTLPPGSYTVSAVSREFGRAEYDAPQFGATNVVLVQPGASVSVELCCTQQNCGVRVNVGDSFVRAFPDGTLYLKSSADELMYPYGERRTAYFLPGDISLLMQENGDGGLLFHREMQAGNMLSVNLTAASSSGDGRISIAVDTTRTWLSEDITVGPGGTVGGGTVLGVADISGHAGEKGVTVCGYIVGVATSTAKAQFEPPFDRNTNILLGPRANTSSREYCVCVELKAGDVRNFLNLADNPGILGMKVIVTGDIVASYYGLPGIKNVTSYEF